MYVFLLCVCVCVCVSTIISQMCMLSMSQVCLNDVFINSKASRFETTRLSLLWFGSSPMTGSCQLLTKGCCLIPNSQFVSLAVETDRHV